MKKLSLNKLMVLSCTAIFALLVLILSPIYIRINADIVLRGTILTDFVYLLIQLFEVLALTVAASLIIRCAISQNAKKTWQLVGVWCAATVLRRLITLMISLVTYGYLEDLEIFSTWVYTLFDAAQISIITAIVLKIAYNHAKNASLKQKAAIRLGDSLKNDIDFSKIFSRTNPYAKCALAASIVISATKIFSRAIFDVFAGLPESLTELAAMVIGYLSDALIFAIAYAVCLLITSRLYNKDI